MSEGATGVEPDKQMVTHAHGGRGFFPVLTNLSENRNSPMGAWNTEGGIQLQQRYDKSRRPDTTRPSPQRRHKNHGFPDRGNSPQPLPQSEAASRG